MKSVINYPLILLPLFFLACSNSPNEEKQGIHSSQRKLIIDTDCGPDDMMAISYLLQQKDVQIEAITSSYGLADVQKGAKNICQVLKLAGQEDIPVYIGNATPMAGDRSYPHSWVVLSEDFSAYHLPQATKSPQKISAVDFLKGRLSSGQAEILTLGALTNIGYVLQEQPQLASSISKLVIMGGAVKVDGNVFSTEEFVSPSDRVEWNLFVDPKAVDIVFRSNVPIHLIPLDATNYVPIDIPFLNAFASAKLTEQGKFVGGLLESIREHAEADHYFAWDPLAAIAWHQEDFTENQEISLRIQTEEPDAGQTLQSKNGKETLVAMKASQQDFNKKFLAAFSQ